MSKLGNLLNFKEYSSKEDFVLKAKPTKRTESSLDVILENMEEDIDEEDIDMDNDIDDDDINNEIDMDDEINDEDDESEMEFIVNNLDKLEDDQISQIYDLVQSFLNSSDDDDDDDLEPTGREFDKDSDDLEHIEDETDYPEPSEEDFEDDVHIKKFEE